MHSAAWQTVRDETAGTASDFRSAADMPRAAQAGVLRRILGQCAETDYGRSRGLTGTETIEQFRARVPVVDYRDLVPWIEAARLGASDTLVPGHPLAFEPTSGSSGACKWIPYTAAMLSSFRSALCVWFDDLLDSKASPAGGRVYFALSPAVRREAVTPGGTPVGLPGGDLAYLGASLGSAFSQLLVLPVGGVPTDLEGWRRATLTALLMAEDLRMISVWSPSFIRVIFRDLLDAGTIDESYGIPGPRLCQIRAALSAAHPLRAIWPDLALVSCWTDGESARWLPQLRECFGDVPIQGKGLLSTEACVSIPITGGDPVAAFQQSFIELMDEDGSPRLLHQASRGGEYEVVVSTEGGLLRYRTGDRVCVSGFYGRTPRLRFLGRGVRTVDLCGEKLSERFLLEAFGDRVPGAWMLAADPGRHQPGYVLVHDTDLERASLDADTLDWALRASVHYDYARTLGQLAPLRVTRVAGWEDAWGRHVRAERSVRLGDIKPPLLLEPERAQSFLSSVALAGVAPAGMERMRPSAASASAVA